MSFEVRHGTFSYRKDTPVLNDISFHADTGSVVSILGANGAGKTTLLKCMLGFLKWDKGETYIDDKNISDYPSRALFQKIAYVPQSRNPSFSYNVKDMVLMGRTSHLSLFAQPAKQDEEIAMEAMSLAGILHLQDKLCNEISGGELQLVLIARALAAKPEILVLDEPETGLDFRNQMIILELVEKLSKENHMTILLNTHYPDHAIRISDYALLLQKDGTGLYGPAADILTQENLQNVFDIEIAMSARTINGKTYYAMIPLQAKREDTL